MRFRGIFLVLYKSYTNRFGQAVLVLARATHHFKPGIPHFPIAGGAAWEAGSETGLSGQDVYYGALGVKTVEDRGRKQEWTEGEAVTP